MVPAGGAAAAVAGSDAESRAVAALLLQLQLVFVWLRKGTVRAHDPSPFVAACSCLGLEFPVLHQNDAAEFLDKLVAAVEKRVKGTPQVCPNAPRVHLRPLCICSPVRIRTPCRAPCVRVP